MPEVMKQFMMLSVVLELTLLTCAQAATPVYFGYVSTDDSTSREILPPMEIALRIINNNSNILPDYELTFIPWISDCDRTVSLNRFLDQVLERCNGSRGDTILGVIGCGCTEADSPVAEIIHRWNIPQISYTSSSAELHDQAVQFPNYFQLHSLEALGRGLQALLGEYGWERLAILTDNSTRFIEASAMISAVLNGSSNSSVLLEQVILDHNNSSVISSSLDSLKDGFRVIFLNTYSDTAREVLCTAYEKDLVLPRYVWIVYGWYSSDWWVTNDTSRCSNDVIGDFLSESRVLALQSYPALENSDDTIIGGITGSEYYSMYKAEQERAGVPFVPEFTVIYDSVWTLALALESTLTSQSSGNTSCGDDYSLENFVYSNSNFGTKVRNVIRQTDFIGASGRVNFDVNGIRVHPSVRVLQYRNGETVVIGTVDVSAESALYNLTYTMSENQTTIYPDVLPLDGTPVKVITTFNTWVIALCYTLAVVGLVFTFICFLFNVIFRKRRIVRLTSPNLNYLILLGAVLVYGTIFVYLIPTKDQQVYRIRCYVQTWTVTLGVTIAFGTVMAKMYRVWHIFKNPSPSKRALRDWNLVLIVLGIVSVGVVLLLVRIAVPQFRIQPMLSRNLENPSGVNTLGVTELYCTWRCIGNNPVANYWQILYYIYVLIILVVALILAIQTRKVKIEVLNDAKWISIIIYIGVPIVVIFFLFTFVLSSYVHLSAAIYCIGLFLASTNFLAFVFIPKMVAFARDPKGENIFGKSSHFSAHTTVNNERHGTMVTMDVQKGNSTSQTSMSLDNKTLN